MSELNIEKILNNQPTQIEEKILKAIFKRNDVILDIIDIVTPNMFTLSDYSNIYTAMIEVYKNENVVNEETVRLYLENKGISVDSRIISKLYNEGYTAIKIKNTAEILKELYNRRYMLEGVNKILEKQETSPTTSNQILDDINKLAMKSNDTIVNENKNTKCCNDVNEVLKNINNKLNKKVQDEGLMCGLHVIDKSLGGLKRKRLWCIVADSQVGKSAFAVQLATNICELNEDIKNITYYSLEMDKEEVTERCLANITNIEPRHISDPIQYFTKFDEETSTFINYYEQNRNSEMVNEYKNSIRDGVQKLHDFKLYIDDTPDLNMETLEARIKKNNLKLGKTDVIIVDHMGILCNGTPSEVVGLMDNAYSRLKQIAKKFDCVVIALHQFGKEIASDPMRFPNIFSLRGSSAPRHYADIICGIYRPEVYPELIKDNPSLKDVCQLIWQKVRYTKKPDTTNMSYNGYKFIEKEPDGLQGDIINGRVLINLDGSFTNEGDYE